jgi:hypothetical protein
MTARFICESEGRWSARLFAMTVIVGAHVARRYYGRGIVLLMPDQHIQHSGRKVGASVNDRLAQWAICCLISVSRQDRCRMNRFTRKMRDTRDGTRFRMHMGLRDKTLQQESGNDQCRSKSTT